MLRYSWTVTLDEVLPLGVSTIHRAKSRIRQIHHLFPLHRQVIMIWKWYEIAEVGMSPIGRFCCKSLFALVIKISFGCTHDFRVKMWGTSLREDKLAGDLGDVIEAT